MQPKLSQDCNSLYSSPMFNLYMDFKRRYSMRAKHIFEELKETPFVVELDLRGISSLCPSFFKMEEKKGTKD